MEDRREARSGDGDDRSRERDEGSSPGRARSRERDRSADANRARSRERGRKGRPRGARLFVAAYPPPDFVAFAKARLGEIALPPHRMTPDEQVHLTLHFIGDTPERELERVLESVERSTAGVAAMTLAYAGLIALPKRGPSRLIAAETDAPSGLLELQRRLVQRLARSPRDKPGNRYLPHLTLCRFRSPSRVLLRGNEGEGTPEWEAPELPLDEIRLMRSVLGPAGARHHEVARFALEG